MRVFGSMVAYGQRENLVGTTSSLEPLHCLTLGEALGDLQLARILLVGFPVSSLQFDRGIVGRWLNAVFGIHGAGDNGMLA